MNVAEDYLSRACSVKNRLFRRTGVSLLSPWVPVVSQSLPIDGRFFHNVRQRTERNVAMNKINFTIDCVQTLWSFRTFPTLIDDINQCHLSGNSPARQPNRQLSERAGAIILRCHQVVPL